jgi:hypothetical protein
MYLALIASEVGSADSLIADAIFQTGLIDVLQQEAITRTPCSNASPWSGAKAVQRSRQIRGNESRRGKLKLL